MVAELDGGEFWLPAEFFNEDFNKEGNRSLAVDGELLTTSIPRSSQPEWATETEIDEEDRNGELIRRLAHTFLYDGSGFSAYSYKIPATETRMWPILSREGPKHPAPMPSSPATSPAQTESELDFLYAAAAWEVMRMRQVERKFNGRRIHSKSSSTAEIPFLTHQHLQLYQMKRQQLIKQQLASAWNWQSRSAWSGRSSTNTAMASPQTGKKAVQIDVRGNRRPSAGTGVFLPKRKDIPSETLKKPASFTVLPARGLPAPKLNLDDAGFHPPCPDRYELVPKKIPAPSPPLPPPPPAVTCPDVLLPTEWTY